MGHRQRVEAMDRAIKKGEEARQNGEPRTANPYKRPTYRPRVINGQLDGAWSLFPFWNIGWDNSAAKKPA